MPIKTTRRTRLRSTLVATTAHMQAAMKQHAAGAAELAARLAPVSDNDEPGHVHMRDVIFVRLVLTGRGRGWSVTVEKDYAVLVEMGTVDTDAHPFFRPAVVSTKRALRADLKIIRGAGTVKEYGR